MGKHHINIARSGVQYYLKSELPTLGLDSIPSQFSKLNVFGVYRPANVLRKSVALFKGTPVVVGHSRLVHSGADDFIVGRCGDSPTLVMVGDEVAIRSDFDVDESRTKGYTELSPAYWSKNKWAPGVTKDGQEFEIVCEEITKVNHLAFVPNARGGAEMKVLDGGKDVIRKIRSGLLRFAKRRTGLVLDGTDDFSTRINTIEQNLNTYSQADLESETQALLAMTVDLPDSVEKDKLTRFIVDIPILVGEAPDVVHEALDAIGSLYAALDTDAIMEGMEGTEMLPTSNNPAPAPAPQQPAANAPAPAPQQPAAQPADVNTQILQLLQQMSAKLDKLTGNDATPPAGDGCTQPVGDGTTIVVQDDTPAPAAEPPKEGATQAEPAKTDAPAAEPPKEGATQAEPAKTDAPAAEPPKAGDTTSIKVTEEEVKKQNDTDTTVPEAIKTSNDGEDIMKPSGVAPSDNGGLNAGNSKAVVGDAMPQFTQTLSAVQAGDSLDAYFSKLKERK